jgi:hypothetical protein
MPDRVWEHDEVWPIRRVTGRDGEGYFFPGEVARMLGVPGIDYYQLRRLFTLVREQGGGTPNEGWSRYTLTDIAALQVVLELCGGKEAVQPGRRLRIKRVRQACQALRDQGVANPLLEVRLHRDPGRERILAEIGGTVFDPVSGQTVLKETLALVIARVSSDHALSEQLKIESRRKPQRTRDYLARGIVVVSEENSEVSRHHR